MRFRGIRIVTLSDSEVNELHIGLKGTMGLYLKERAIVSVATRSCRAEARHPQLIWGLCIDPAGRRMYRLT
jgi:hypothetical protein